MKYSILAVAFLILNSFYSYSQDIELTLKSGFIKEINTISGDKGNLDNNAFSLRPRIDILCNYNTENNVIYGMALGYYRFSDYSDLKNSKGNIGSDIFKAISIPMQIGYKFNLHQNFYLTYSSGLSLDFYFGASKGVKKVEIDRIDGTSSQSDVYTMHYDNSLKKNFNILLANTLRLSYEIDDQFTLNMYITYHAGLRDVWESHGIIQKNSSVPTDIINPILHSRGSHYNFGLGIGYIFRR